MLEAFEFLQKVFLGLMYPFSCVLWAIFWSFSLLFFVRKGTVAGAAQIRNRKAAERLPERDRRGYPQGGSCRATVRRERCRHRQATETDRPARPDGKPSALQPLIRSRACPNQRVQLPESVAPHLDTGRRGAF